jgi:tRNA(Ile)-lysidine synthase
VTLFPKGFYKWLEELVPHAKTFVVAVSGGPDSMALLRLMYERDEWHPSEDYPEFLSLMFDKSIVEIKQGFKANFLAQKKRFHVAHFDHALRENSREDAEFVKRVCHEDGLSFFSERVDVAKIARERKWNLEDAARRLRYSFLTRVAKHVKADAILTAHTLDDQVETVLMQLLRGSAYVTGMQVVQGNIVRPLLHVPRQKLLEVLASYQQEFRIDESNFDTTKTRAWLRHEIMPKLENRYPTIKQTLVQFAKLQQDQKAHFEREALRFIGRDKVPKEVEAEKFLKADVATQRQIIATLAKDLELHHIEEVRNQVIPDTHTRISLPHGQIARIAYGELSILSPEHYAPVLPEPIPFAALDKQWLERMGQAIDLAKLGPFENLVLRKRQNGDTIQLQQGKKKTSDVFINLKIPKEERDRIPVLASGQEVLWIQDVVADIRVAKPSRNLDVDFMKRALGLAQEAANKNELPVGCVIVKDSQIIAEAHNETETTKDPTAHAEVLAMRRAAEKLGDWRLEDCTLYVTLEPCPMCFGTILQAHVSKVVYGARNARDGALGSVMDMQDAQWKRKVEIKSGVLAKECGKLLTKFFEKKR